MTDRDLRTRIRRRATRADVTIPAAVFDALVRYYLLLGKWNAKINLTSLPIEPGGTDEAVDRLLIEPLVAAQHVAANAQTAIDIGSGGGSPAIPLALMAPHLSFRLVESKTRKAVFLREALRELNLAGRVVVDAARYEELLARPSLHEGTDLVTLRAVRVESRTLVTLQAFLRSGGHLFLFRSATSPTAAVTPPLRWIGTYPLMPNSRSNLIVMTKDLISS